nr:MAG TPA_asm: hypothetical protein [Caudoviricetes sp.]
MEDLLAKHVARQSYPSILFFSFLRNFKIKNARYKNRKTLVNKGFFAIFSIKNLLKITPGIRTLFFLFNVQKIQYL